MDYKKIGIFIAFLRKKKDLTQKQLANQLHITDKAVSKWERGLGCPDVSLLGELSEILGVGIGELLNGEENITLKDNNEFITNAVNYSKSVSENKIYKNIYNFLIIIASALCMYLVITSIFQINYLNRKDVYKLDTPYVSQIKEQYEIVREKASKIYELDNSVFNNYELEVLTSFADELMVEPYLLNYSGDQIVTKYQCNLENYNSYEEPIILLQIAEKHGDIDPIVYKIFNSSVNLNLKPNDAYLTSDNILVCEDIYSNYNVITTNEKLNYLMFKLNKFEYALDAVLKVGGYSE